MERIVSQMGSVSQQLSPELLAQILKAQGQGIGDSKVRHFCTSAQNTKYTTNMVHSGKQAQLHEALLGENFNPISIQPLFEKKEE